MIENEVIKESGLALGRAKRRTVAQQRGPPGKDSDHSSRSVRSQGIAVQETLDNCSVRSSESQ